MTENDAKRIVFQAQRSGRSVMEQAGFSFAEREEKPCLDFFTASRLIGGQFARGYCEYWNIPVVGKNLEKKGVDWNE